MKRCRTRKEKVIGAQKKQAARSIYFKKEIRGKAFKVVEMLIILDRSLYSLCICQNVIMYQINMYNCMCQSKVKNLKYITMKK